MSNSLKEAFLNLASSLGHCQENSRSIVDVLKRGCADLANNSEGGGGGGSSDYSTTEHIVGKWIDGTTDVYEISLSTAIPNNTQASYNHNISNIAQIISVEGGAWGDNQFLPANMSGYVQNSNEGALRVTATKTAVVVQPIGWDGSSYTGYWTLRYLKTS